MALGYEAASGPVPFSLIQEQLALLIPRAALAITTQAVSKRSFSISASQNLGSDTSSLQGHNQPTCPFRNTPIVWPPPGPGLPLIFLRVTTYLLDVPLGLSMVFSHFQYSLLPPLHPASLSRPLALLWPPKFLLLLPVSFTWAVSFLFPSCPIQNISALDVPLKGIPLWVDLLSFQGPFSTAQFFASKESVTNGYTPVLGLIRWAICWKDMRSLARDMERRLSFGVPALVLIAPGLHLHFCNMGTKYLVFNVVVRTKLVGITWPAFKKLISTTFTFHSLSDSSYVPLSPSSKGDTPFCPSFSLFSSPSASRFHHFLSLFF